MPELALEEVVEGDGFKVVLANVGPVVVEGEGEFKVLGTLFN